MIKVDAKIAKAIAEEVKLNLDCFTFDTATAKNKALHDLLARLYNNVGCFNTSEWFNIQGIYKRYMQSDMEHLYDIEAEIITYIDKYFNADDNEA